MKKFVLRAIDYLNDKRLTTVAGAWVFFFLTSVVPLVFLLITAFGVFGVDITLDLVSRLPEEFRATGEAIATTAQKATSEITIFFITSVILSCTTLLNQMSKDGDSIYGIKSKIKRGLLRRVWAFIALAVLFLIFLGLALAFSFGTTLFQDRLYNMNNQLILTIISFSLVISFGYVIIIVLNKFISPVRLKVKQVWLGSFISLFVIVLGTISYMIYLRTYNSYNAFYGSLAAILIFLLWSYIVMLGLVFGVILNARLYNKHTLKENNSLGEDYASNQKSNKKIRQGLQGG